MTTQTTYAARAYAGEADLQPICDLLNLCDAVDKLDDSYDVDALRLEFTSPDLDPAQDLRLWEDGAGRIVGFGQLWIPQAGEAVDGFLYFRIHPDSRDTALADEIVAWGTARLQRLGGERGLPVKMRSGVREHEIYNSAVLRRHGFSIVRYFFKMARPLDEPIPEPQFPDGFTLQHTAGEADAERWVEMFNQSFIDHWNHHPQTVEGHRHWLTDPNYQPEGDLIAVAPDGTFAAFCFCLINPEDNTRNNRNEGWIDVLGTRRGFRKIGLGRAMLLAGLHRLKDEGMDTAVLGVDAENPTGALRLYESVGFTNVRTSVSYAKELED